MMIPTLNCTKDVLESFSTSRTPKIFGYQTSTPSPAEIKYNIEQCELMKMETINEANEVLATSTGNNILVHIIKTNDYNILVPGMSGPCTVYYIEIGVGLVEVLISIICVVMGCRAVCSRSDRPAAARQDVHPGEVDPALTEEQKWELVVQEYNEYRK